MKLVRFRCGNKIGYGVLAGETVKEGEQVKKVEQIKEIESVKGNLRSFMRGDFSPTGESYSLEQINLLPPCVPSKVICLGLNYRHHAAEMGLQLPESPIVFLKPNTCVIGPEDSIKYPRQSRRVDYEAELAVVIGAEASQVEASESLNYVLGYTCAQDVTARDLQPKEGQWTYAKGFDTFAPLGPWVETGIKDPESLHISGYLNGELVQSAPTSDHIFSVSELIAYISSCMTLLPGDVIMTGTPSGIGPMQIGDTFQVEIDGVGILCNQIE